MKNGKFWFAVKICAMSISLVLVGCTTTPPAITPTNEPIASPNTIVATLEPATATPTPLPTTQPPSATPSQTPVPTSTPTRLPTIQPTATETPFTIPTPVGTNTLEQILWLFETNNGCQLPCWWGIVPGQTEWETAEKLFSRFDFSIDERISPDDPDLIGYTPVLDLPREVFIENQTQIGVLTRNGIVVKINTRVSIGNTPKQYLSKYRLSAFLLTYGQPSEIWVSSSPYPFENNELPFNVLLFYYDLGVMALFSDNAILQDGIVTGCPQNDPAKALSLWSPDDSLSFEEVKNGYAVYNTHFLALDETKSIDIDTFYERFKNSANTDCLEIPAEVWNY
jgi:hypothetical protein